MQRGGECPEPGRHANGPVLRIERELGAALPHAFSVFLTPGPDGWLDAGECAHADVTAETLRAWRAAIDCPLAAHEAE